MLIRQVMSLSFSICSSRTTIQEAIQTVLKSNSSRLYVVDDYNSYLGVVTALSLLGTTSPPHREIAPLVRYVAPLRLDDSIAALRHTSEETIPVTNSDHCLVGVVTLGDIVENLPELLNPEFKTRGEGRKTVSSGSKYSIDDIVGKSRSILYLKEQILAAAKTRSTVLVLGETGTGKELVAHAIHKLSTRRHRAFVRINCAAIPDNLLESELFGYEQGAFTGALKGGNSGKFELADGGTIFLDEIGDMSLSLQAKILRVLQEREIERIGGRYPVPIDVRIIAATHCDLQSMVQEGRFREDLFYRLHVFPIRTPPLRTIPEDIPFLTEHFISTHAVEAAGPVPLVTPEALRILEAHFWPGNCRELFNAIEYASSFSSGAILPEHLPANLLTAQPTGEEACMPILRSHANDAERDTIIRTIRTYHGNKLKVSEVLGISRSSLYNKMKKYKIEG